MTELRMHYDEALVRAKYATDVAEGIFNVRGLFEACLEDIWRASSGGSGASSVTDKLKLLLARVPGGKPPPPLPGAARLSQDRCRGQWRSRGWQALKLYDVLSERLHSDVVESTTRLPAELYKPSGRTTMIALAAFVRFIGREITLYGTVRRRQLAPGPQAALARGDDNAPLQGDGGGAALPRVCVGAGRLRTHEERPCP